MNKQRTVLGRGLSALIPTTEDTDKTAQTDNVHLVPIENIQAAQLQPRTCFETEKLEELASSIRKDGILQPILLRTIGENAYEIIAGERRYRAAHRAGLHELPAVIRETTAAQAFEWAMVENIQRQDLNPIEEAQAYETLKDTLKCSQEALAQRVGKRRVTVANSLRLLQLSSTVRKFIEEGLLTAGHGRALLMAPKQVQLPLARQAVEESWTVRKLEGEAKRLSEAHNADPLEKKPAKPNHNHPLEAQLRAILSAPVKVVQKRGKGRIEIRFHSHEEMYRIVDFLSKHAD